MVSLVDFFLLLMLPNEGDELQGIKRGIMELEDGLVVNKADGEGALFAEQTRGHYQNALQLLKHPEYWQPQVVCCSALQQSAIDTVWQMIMAYCAASNAVDEFAGKRARQNIEWMKKLLHEMIDLRLQQNPQVAERLPVLNADLVQGKITPYKAARELLAFL